jgi:hypothetical protein
MRQKEDSHVSPMIDYVSVNKFRSGTPLNPNAMCNRPHQIFQRNARRSVYRRPHSDREVQNLRQVAMFSSLVDSACSRIPPCILTDSRPARQTPLEVPDPLSQRFIFSLD